MTPPRGGGVRFEGGAKIASKSLRNFASILDAFLLRLGVPKSSEIEPKSLPTRSWSQLGVGSRFRIRFGTILVAKMAQISIIFIVFLALLLHPFSPLFRDRFFSPPLSSASLFGAARKKAHMLKVLALPIHFNVFSSSVFCTRRHADAKKQTKSIKKRIPICIIFSYFLVFFLVRRALLRKSAPRAEKTPQNGSQIAPKTTPDGSR